MLMELIKHIVHGFILLLTLMQWYMILLLFLSILLFLLIKSHLYWQYQVLCESPHLLLPIRFDLYPEEECQYPPSFLDQEEMPSIQKEECLLDGA
jgi:hypothetical protein